MENLNWSQNLNPNCAALSFHFKGCLTTILLRTKLESFEKNFGNWSQMGKRVIAIIESQIRRPIPSSADWLEKENLLPDDKKGKNQITVRQSGEREIVKMQPT